MALRASGQREWCDEHRVLTQSGKVKWVRAVARPMFDDDGKSLGYVGCVEDITERKLGEQALREAQQQLGEYAKELELHVAERTGKLQQTVHSLESFCYTIAHDLRAPLRSLQGFAIALMEDHAPHLDSEGRDYCLRMVKSARHMDILISDLLSYGQLAHKALPLGPVDLKLSLHSVVTELSAEIQNTNASVVLEAPFPDVMGNTIVLEQVMKNLMGNALKFVPTGRRPEIKITAETNDSWVRISVRDNGIGIAPPHHQRIFGMFERLHSAATFPGTGIGLAIVSKGIERMNGRAGVQSELEKGSTFWVELPLARG